MMQKATLSIVILMLPMEVFGIPSNSNPTAVKTVTTGNLLSWSIGLVIVLSVFFLLVWLLKKINTGSVTGSGQLRIMGGLSLGMRERIVLLKAGNKQLILGVSPGRIETLHVLEGEDCLANDSERSVQGSENSFAKKLSQVMQWKNHD